MAPIPVEKPLSRLDMKHHLWYEGNLGWKLDALQILMRDTINKAADAKKVCILSSRQIGKSFFSCIHALGYTIKQENRIARIMAPTETQCQDIVNDNLSPILLDAPPRLVTKLRSEQRWNVSNGSSLRLGSMQRAHVDKNRGGVASLIIYEEVGFVSGEEFTYAVNSVLGPQLLRSNGLEIFVSSPSEDPDHPLHTQILPECEELGTSFRFTVFDSPSISPKNILEAMSRSKCVVRGEFEHWVKEGVVTTGNVHELAGRSNTILSESFRREYLAEIIRPSTMMIIPDYDERLHVKPFRVPMHAFFHTTIDWGGVRDKTVALLHCYDFLENKDLIIDERVFPANTGTRAIVESIRGMEEQVGRPIESRWADVPGQIQVDLGSSHDYSVQLPQKTDWLAAVQAMAVKFRLDQIYIHPRCTFLRKSCRAGMFNKTRTDFGRHNEELGHCDSLAALMYAIRSANRDNPYPTLAESSDIFFNIPKAPGSEVSDLGSALNPKGFGRYKNGQ